MQWATLPTTTCTNDMLHYEHYVFPHNASINNNNNSNNSDDCNSPDRRHILRTLRWIASGKTNGRLKAVDMKIFRCRFLPKGSFRRWLWSTSMQSPLSFNQWNGATSTLFFLNHRSTLARTHSITHHALLILLRSSTEFILECARVSDAFGCLRFNGWCLQWKSQHDWSNALHWR